MTEVEIIRASWPAPQNVVAFTSTRIGGVSVGPYASCNLGDHVGDNEMAVQDNRRLLREQHLFDEADPVWLNQVHGDRVRILDSQRPLTRLMGDASYTQTPQRICAVMTADCLPVLLCNRAGTEVSAVHVGWRGCVAGILANAVDCFHSPSTELLAWLGPCIGPEAFEVGAEVYEAFVTKDPENAEAFQSIKESKYLANLYQLATLALAKSGVKAVYGGDYCTVSDQKRFFSHRRDGGVTGRMASMIYC
jgi:hypothetical protein